MATDLGGSPPAWLLLLVNWRLCDDLIQPLLLLLLAFAAALICSCCCCSISACNRLCSFDKWIASNSDRSRCCADLSAALRVRTVDEPIGCDMAEAVMRN